MNKETIHSTSQIGKSKSAIFKMWVRKTFIIEKLNNKFGYLFFATLFTAITFGIANNGVAFGILMLMPAIVLPAIYAFVTYPRIGITVFLTLAYFIMLIARIGVNFPLGTLMDGMEALFLLGLFIQQKKKKDWSTLKGPITTWILIWMIFNFLEVANPTTEARGAWVYTVRSVAVVMVTYFIFLFNIRTIQFVRFIIKLWLSLSFIGAAYAFKQEHFGFFPFEEAYLHSDPGIALLLFIGGTWRKFSIFNDPVVFAYIMAVSTLLCVGLLTGPFKKWKKAVLWFLIFSFMLNMLYSGTRGAFVLVPAGMILYAILKYNKNILIIAIIGAVSFIGIINVPTSNQTLYRFQTAFKPNDDLSYKVRKINQKRIQPYILSHPMGGGLGSTGEWGKRFAPGSFLSSFPPDSGYVRVAVECGWLGLLILCIFMFTVLKTGINSYYKIRDPELKSYCLAMVLVIFAFHIGNFPQEALVQFPSNVYFYLGIALIGVTSRLDNEQNKIKDATK